MHLAVKSLTAHFLDVIGLTKKKTSSFCKGLKPITALPSVLLTVAMPLPIQFLNRAIWLVLLFTLCQRGIRADSHQIIYPAGDIISHNQDWGRETSRQKNTSQCDINENEIKQFQFWHWALVSFPISNHKVRHSTRYQFYCITLKSIMTAILTSYSNIQPIQVTIIRIGKRVVNSTCVSIKSAFHSFSSVQCGLCHQHRSFLSWRLV